MLLYFFLTLFLQVPARAHSTVNINKSWWAQWNSSYLIIINLLLLTVLYFWGYKNKQTRSKKNLHTLKYQKIFYSLGLLFLAIALLSPVDTLSDSLAWMHMLQHTILMMVAAPLIAASSVGHLAQWSIPARVWRNLWPIRKHFKHWGRPFSIFFLYSLTLWIWHIPYLYEEALHNSWVHDLQHLSFFITSFWFWKILIDPYAKNLLRPELGLIYLFITSLHAMFLGVLMALSPVPWYESYLLTAPIYGISALHDQQLAGLIMWMPAGLTYLLVALVLFSQVLQTASGANFLDRSPDA